MLKKFRPITPGTRQKISVVPDGLTKGVKPLKKLLRTKKRSGGRNNTGRITCRHRGGGHKKKYRLIDFKRDKDGIPAAVATIEYDPNRNSLIALLHYVDGEKRYILCPQGLKEGAKLLSGPDAPFRIGCAMALKDMPLGSVVHNIEMYPGRGGQFVRSAGLSAQLMARSGGYATLRMPSGEIRLIHENCRATFGVVSNSECRSIVKGKAGANRWRGKRPTVRGVAMNPVDHPHGGGEGKGKGNIPQSPWGVPKGFRTRCKKKTKKHIVKDRRKK